MIRAKSVEEYRRREAEATRRAEAEFGPEPQAANVRGFLFGICAVAAGAAYLWIQPNPAEDGRGLTGLAILAFVAGCITAIPARWRWRQVYRRHAADVQQEAERSNESMQV